MSATEKVSVRFPPAIMREIDELVESGGFSSRSELIKEAVRFFLMHYESPQELWESYKLLARVRKLPSEKELEKLLEEVDRKWKRSRSS
ncbi:ribbon-helix-helix domain-containing protein [Thermococcus celer]|uniref:Ribbon-helix-helix protein CopG domain-containing protein n=1 Tax=Thermococcus celer Vu 13 = JCM 8558 TaxID=1293037 RepID=A0A218P1Q5_THECE|nr:ribbon-helix-helix domain-containing protein [Thermococcus celer]ASI98861.1 hypothetical protein A3L02_04450 [Thermococcus celer Vu 13 = JCM 8558]